MGKSKRELMAQDVGRTWGWLHRVSSTRETRVQGQDVRIMERGDGVEKARGGDQVGLGQAE